MIYYTLLEKLRGLIDIVEVIDSDIKGIYSNDHVVLIPLLCFKDQNFYETAVDIEPI